MRELRFTAARAAWAGSGAQADEGVWFDVAEEFGGQGLPYLMHTAAATISATSASTAKGSRSAKTHEST